ncbi:sterol desaturase family protein [Nocardia sp. alder85J]|uniref:sterol desaturase family protein n=1 Tax=Nocardia sp. alder85J TaxID=2862949 RepID=UPI001CD28373|nr:sterol desaturase family protein [Nocardia sp. alder85J]MCX4091309.1 sterol desaturase family protein [Nocardia sp. alder85J]
MTHQELALYAVPAFVLLMLVEWIGNRRDPQRAANGFSGRDTASNWTTYLLGQLTKPIGQLIVPFSAIVLAAGATPLHLPANRWWAWLLGLVVTDFCYYWAHRADHRIRLQWTAHNVHHSSTYFNLSTAIRLSWLNPIAATVRSLFWVPAALLGFPAWMIFLLISIGLLYQFPLHTQRIGTLWNPIEFIFNTPAHHRIHHGSNQPYLDRNYGGILIIWDRMFGSFAPLTEPITYGITHDIGTDNPLRVNYHEFAAMLRDIRHADTWRGRLGYIFAPPGWTESSTAASSASASSASAPLRRVHGPHGPVLPSSAQSLRSLAPSVQD